MSKLQLTDLWFKIWHFTHLWYALLGFCNPPLPFSVINMKHIKNLKKTRSKWGICKNLKLRLENFNRTQKSLKHELYHKISHLGNNKKVKEVTSLSLSPPPPSSMIQSPYPLLISNQHQLSRYNHQLEPPLHHQTLGWIFPSISLSDLAYHDSNPGLWCIHIFFSNGWLGGWIMD